MFNWVRKWTSWILRNCNIWMRSITWGLQYLGWNQILELCLGNSPTSPEQATKPNCAFYQKKKRLTKVHFINVYCVRESLKPQLHWNRWQNFSWLTKAHNFMFNKKKIKNQKPGSSEITAWPCYKLAMWFWAMSFKWCSFLRSGGGNGMTIIL